MINPEDSPPQSDTLDREDRFILKRSTVYATLVPLAFVMGLAVGYLLWGRSTAVAPQAAVSTPATEDNAPVRRYDVPVDDDPALGPENAAITIIEFSDFECPYCQRWHVEVWGRLQQAYPGQVRLVYRDFPLPNHANAVPAAEAANCAGEQGKYWEYHEMLFTAELGLNAEAYAEYASRLNLDTARFNQCLEADQFAAEIQADFDYAANLGVRSTPTFFINGLPMVGAQPFEVFQQVIDQELAGEIP